MRIDPYRHQERYVRWREKSAAGVPGISADDLAVIRAYLGDMELGRNIARGSKKGGRSYIHLNNMRLRLVFFARQFAGRYGLRRMTDLTEAQAHDFFAAMRSGRLRRKDGRQYRCAGNYVKVLKSFWHWHMKVERQAGRRVADICEELDDSRDKPPWVYLTEEDVRRLCEHAKFEYRVLLLFLYDSGIRSPTELVNIRVHDLSDECRQLRISEEASKTFGRTIKLMLCSEVLQRYVREKGLSGGDQVFPISPGVVNKYLKRLAGRVLGDGRTAAGSRYSELTMYDFRHSSACYWRPRYKQPESLLYRFGWKSYERLNYYTEFLGMQDTITQDDLLLGGVKTEVEADLVRTTREKQVLEAELESMRAQMERILGVVDQLAQKVDQGDAGDQERPLLARRR